MATVAVVQLFEPVQLTTGAVVIYTSPSTPPTTTVNGVLRLTNITAGAVAVTAYSVPSGGSAADSNAFLKAFSVAANNYTDLPLPVLAPGDTFQALAGAGASINVSSLGGLQYS